jgi:hypothetical protein
MLAARYDGLQGKGYVGLWSVWNEPNLQQFLTPQYVGKKIVSPTNYANRGCMSQLGSRCLADQGDSFDTILKFYYGGDIGIVQSTGACITPPSLPDGGSVVGADGGVVGTKPSPGDGSTGGLLRHHRRLQGHDQGARQA